jgi:polysaccharide export outer membrane protein
MLNCFATSHSSLSGACFMKLGRFRFKFRDGALSLALIAPLATTSAAQTQQQKPPDAATPDVPTLPPGQPVSQVAVPTTPPSTNQAKDAAKKDASAQDSPSEPSPPKLGAGDLIELSVYGVPELSSKIRIGNSGDVYLPLIDYVHVGDLTVEEAQTLIEKRLSDGGFVRSPHVSIFVTESTSQGVTLLGEVAKPGIYPDLGDHKLYEIISQAGGFTVTAARKVSIIRRNQPDTINLTLPRNLADDLSSNVEIFPGDTVMVPRAPIIYIVGDVGRPSGLLVENGKLTVLQAIALAGGTNKTAKMNGVRIIRKGPTGVTETEVPLKKMLAAKAPDVTLEADDILFVPISGGRVLAGRTFDLAMQAAGAATIYSVRP